MYRIFVKILFCLCLVVGYVVGSSYLLQESQVDRTEKAMLQMHDDAQVQNRDIQEHNIRNILVFDGWCVVVVICFFVFVGEIVRLIDQYRKTFVTIIVIPLLFLTGCSRKPFEPIKLEVIGANEEAFLIPLTGDGKKQKGSTNEDYLRQNLVYTKQVKVPQQWVAKGYENYSWNGEWRDAAVLIKVNKSPVTREWTADPNTGTSNKNEAVWVMTSDQVEFSTGWTITARIETHDDAVKFLHNYPNGTLEKVMDSEVRSKLQAVFGLEVTDLPMEELRKNATPHILKTNKTVIDFFKDRGIAITNIGITGGFIYKDRTIIETMVKVFNAEQEQAVAKAKTNAQQELNKAVILKAQGEADAILKTRKAEADGVKMIADAKSYEMEKAKGDLQTYMGLKQMELQRELLHKWDGKYPSYFMGGASSPQMLLQLPQIPGKEEKK